MTFQKGVVNSYLQREETKKTSLLSDKKKIIKITFVCSQQGDIRLKAKTNNTEQQQKPNSVLLSYINLPTGL